MNSSINRALIFQGGGSLGAYEAGAYKAINEELSAYCRTVGGVVAVERIGNSTLIF